MERNESIIAEMQSLIVDGGYSINDSFILIIDKYYIKNNNDYSFLPSDLIDIANRAAFKASNEIVAKEKEGKLNRMPKELKNNPLKSHIAERKKINSPLFSDIYGNPVTLEEKVQIKWKEFRYKFNNTSKAINELFRYFSIDVTNPDLKKMDKVLSIIKKL